jgi:hypothetical protein
MGRDLGGNVLMDNADARLAPPTDTDGGTNETWVPAALTQLDLALERRLAQGDGAEPAAAVARFNSAF